MAFFSGLDLGQQSDYSALVVVEQSRRMDPDEGPYNAYDVRHIHRWNLGTSYPDIVKDVYNLFEMGELSQSTLVIDATGVGRPVVDMVRDSKPRANVQAYSITCGSKEGDHTVPKIDLVGAVQSLLQNRRLRFSDALPLTPILVAELENFRVKVTADRNETFAAGREADHDDLVLALAMALWFGERKGGISGPPPRPGKPIVPAYMGTSLGPKRW